MNSQRIWIAYLTILRRELKRCFRIWPQTIMPPAITTTLYFVIFGRLIGSQIPPVEGFTYIQYIVPGLIMMSIIMNAYINASSSFFSSKFQRSIEEVLVSPTPNYIILLGYISGSVVRAVVVGFIVTVIALFFTHLMIHHVLLMLLVVLLTSMFFATVGFINGVYAKSFDDVSWIPSFVITPLTYFGGVFFSISMLTSFWQKVAYLDPVLYIVNAFRYSLLNVSSSNVPFSLLVLFVVTIGTFYYALRLLKHSEGLRS
jgi:ABC-2 type transport system permease protein